MSRRGRFNGKVAEMIRRHVPAPEKGVEIGVWKGELSEALLKEFPSLVLWMVDPYESREGYKLNVARQSVWDAVDRTERFSGRRFMVVARSASVLQCPGLGELDFAFLDGDHSEPGVTIDMLWWGALKHGGLLCGHDYGGARWPGVKKVVDRFAAGKELPLQVCDKVEGLWCLVKP